MDSDKLISNLENNIYNFYGEKFIEDLELFSSVITNFEHLAFENCIFKSISIYDIKNKFMFLKFHNCTFEGEIKILRCNINNLQFSSLKEIQKISIIYGHFDNIHIDSCNNIIDGNIEINECFINETLDCSNLILKKGQFTLSSNRKNKDTNLHFKTYFKNSTIDYLNFSNCKFGHSIIFNNFKTLNSILFDTCEFQNTTFKGMDFGKASNIHNCHFKLYTSFINCKNINETHLKISSCSFRSFSHFNDSKFNRLEISHTTFEKKVSFDSMNVNSINLFQVLFEQGAYFDDIQIKKINDCDRKTILTIKQELQKAENRIDFSRFRNYELIAHYKELSFRHNFKDKFILWATKWSSNYGSWTWAFWFTLIICLVFFTSYFILENLDKSFNLSNWEDFVYGYFRFFLITDFKNEYYQDGESILKFNCILSLVPFIIGKIAVAFGLYEMIQSFRKFKA
jgi:hypothetical protein